MLKLSPCRNKVQTQKTPCLLGAHFSIARGLHNALYEARALGCNALQIFTKNSNTWKERTLSQEEIDSFNKAKEFTGITSIASHTSYLINLATHEKKKHAMSCNVLKNELIRSSMLGIPFVVLHPGAHGVRYEHRFKKIISLAYLYAQSFVKAQYIVVFFCLTYKK